jgi:hypothetical protein
MNLALRNQLKRLTELAPYSGQTQSRISMKSVTAGVIATLVTGVNYYFQNFVADKENERQKQLIERVSND